MMDARRQALRLLGYYLTRFDNLITFASGTYFFHKPYSKKSGAGIKEAKRTVPGT
jgi:hypothetical protein